MPVSISAIWRIYFSYDLAVNGVDFDVYVRLKHGDSSDGTSDTWTYIAFTTTESILSGPLDIHEFIDFLIEKGIISSDNYLTSIELGNEVVGGEGTAEIENYSLVVTQRK
ncbi:MAG: hypothetical protein JXB48_22995 [Candidatus Latescibacteria bacterium]|nr:hypothetical protein [Candidatus Latescibacterota bacterium]